MGLPVVRDTDLDAAWRWELEDLATDVVGVHVGPRRALVPGTALASRLHVLENGWELQQGVHDAVEVHPPGQGNPTIIPRRQVLAAGELGRHGVGAVARRNARPHCA
eukprot:12708142-Prorocentrum_lima.AAC.1